MEVGYLPRTVLYSAEMGPSYRTRVQVNQTVVQALLDSGCKQSVINKRLVLPRQIIPNASVPIRCVHGDVKTYPLAEITLVPFQMPPCRVKVGVVSTLPEDLIIGIDNPRFMSLFTQSRRGEESKTTKEALVTADPWTLNRSFHFAQTNEPTLLNAWENAHSNSDNPAAPFPRFIIDKDLLYRIGKEGEDHQLVVPRDFRDQVLFYAHTHLTAGHGGAEKTTQALLRHFYWPGIYKDTPNYCQTCEVCQLSNLQKPPAVPLQPLPIIGTPFERVGMDLIGPLPKTSKGNKYVLVIVDYATRFPEAFPLRAPTSQNIADKMIELFSHVGFPKEVLTDQGTPFISKLMKEVCKTLHIHPLRTAVYHPQTDGLVERYNQTIKTTLKKMLLLEKTEWDRLLPLALFVIRSQVQSSLGCSAFEMLYGRVPRTLLEITKEAWEHEEPNDTRAMLDYTQELRSKLGKIRELAYSSLERSQTRQKQHYDKGKRWRSVDVGDLVLVLLPSSSHKFQRTWMGPYRVRQRLGPTTYRIQMAPRREQTFHINLLKKWRGSPP